MDRLLDAQVVLRGILGEAGVSLDAAVSAEYLLQTLNTTITYGGGRLENILDGIRYQYQIAKTNEKKSRVYRAFFLALGVKEV